MKEIHKILYILGALIIFMTMLGSTITKPVFGNMAESTLETAGVNKNKIDSMDAGIDDMFFKMNQLMLQVEKLKNFFSDKKIDENKYKREEKHIISNAIYEPMKEVVIFLYRVLFFSLGFFILAAAGITHIVWRNILMKKRISHLERAVKKLEDRYN